MKEFAKEIQAPARLRPDKTLQVHTSGIDQIWTADLANLAIWENADFEGYNDGYKYFLIVLDCFSRYMWIRPLKSATAKETWEAFKNILTESKRKPQKLWVDEGREFEAAFKTGCKKEHIEIYHDFTGRSKAALAERAIRTIAHKLWLKLTEHQSRRWIEWIDDCVNEYNNEDVHRSIGMTPAEASKPDHEEALWLYQYGHVEPNVMPKFKVGDFVRISRIKGVFEKQDHNWSFVLYEIKKVHPGNPVAYTLREQNMKQNIKGLFYENELQKTEAPNKNVFLVHKILQERTNKRGDKEYLVQWVGHSDEHNSWISARDTTLKFDN